MDPFQYFEGGKQGVIERFFNLMAPIANGMRDEYRKVYIQYGDLPADFFERIAAGDRTVVTETSIQTFQITINEGFGEFQNFGPDEKAKWLAKANGDGFVSVSAPMPDDSRVRLYVLIEGLRALGE